MCRLTKEKKGDGVQATTGAIATQPFDDGSGELCWDPRAEATLPHPAEELNTKPFEGPLGDGRGPASVECHVKQILLP
ncbi:hypothetical protein AV530_007115 [Patagioenas fasciata monilis]|uniref:Uncharacterized protein n=1 Tax=Patagioenas fasciata monilis TaxID=372326 RepID=A0A1V4KZL8_PATFA|nr:hypothetical protein AV530_007115 [Patagioenas fasciata monilis]